jgi:sulfite exporter TauE/SafE
VSAALAAAALTLAASAHCAGMCGGFAIAASAGAVKWRLVLRQLLLQAGKATTYAFLGALAGTFGGALLANRAFTWSGRALAVLSGLALFAAGLTLLGAWRGGDAVSRRLAPYFSRLVSPLLAARPNGFPLVIGMAMGLLPCPLVYAGLGAAAASGTPLSGALVMAGVALGTIPALALVAGLGTAVAAVWRRPLARVAGVLLIATEVVTIARGAGLHAGHSGHGGHAAHDSSECCQPGR